MMAFSFLKKTISIAASGLVVLSLAACHGIGKGAIGALRKIAGSWF